MIEYETPVANTVEFEAVDVIAVSIPDFLITWGSKVDDVGSTPDFYN